TCLAFVPLVDPPAHPLHHAFRVSEPLHLAIERVELLAVLSLHRRRRLVDDRVELVRDRERGRAGAVDARGRRSEHRTQRTEPSRERTRPGELTAGQRGKRGRIALRNTLAYEYRPHVVVGDRIEVDALAARRDRREQIVGRAGDEHDDRAIWWLPERRQHGAPS